MASDEPAVPRRSGAWRVATFAVVFALAVVVGFGLAAVVARTLGERTPTVRPIELRSTPPTSDRVSSDVTSATTLGPLEPPTTSAPAPASGPIGSAVPSSAQAAPPAPAPPPPPPPPPVGALTPETAPLPPPAAPPPAAPPSPPAPTDDDPDDDDEFDDEPDDEVEGPGDDGDD